MNRLTVQRPEPVYAPSEAPEALLLRGVLYGALLSLLGFWLPVVAVVTWWAL